MSGFPNKQSNPAGAIPVWVVAGGASIPPGAVLIEFAQMTDLLAAHPLVPPTGATIALVQVNAGIVRYRRDGVDPTASVGMLSYATGPFLVFTEFDDLAFIETAPSASLNIEWYGPAA